MEGQSLFSTTGAALHDFQKVSVFLVLNSGNQDYNNGKIQQQLSQDVVSLLISCQTTRAVDGLYG